MKEITAKLVSTFIDEESGASQRYYELSEPITKGYGFNGIIDIDVAQLKELDSTRKEYQKYLHFDGAHAICVSDATTHIERVVFAAENFNGTYSILRIQIDGKMTMMIHGGDSRAVYDDKVYLRHLGMLNKVTIRIIES